MANNNSNSENGEKSQHKETKNADVALELEFINRQLAANLEISDAVFENLKKSWIAHGLKKRQDEFTNKFSIQLYLGTWNVNGKKPEGLNAWLQFTNGNPPDIVGIGIQELDMTTESLLLREMVSRSAPWNEALLQALNQRPDLVEYSLVASKQLVGLLLCIFVNKKHLNNVSEVQFTVVATGTLGVMGNKGAVAIRFKFYDSTFCIINAHFNAHQTNVQRRNQDYHEIFNRIVFYVDNQLFNILDHDHIFWLGDLNYRIDLSDNEVRAKIAEKDWNALLAADQLVNQMKAKNVFPGWQEGVIDFAPTYKYVIGTNEYDNSDGTKRRIPAWCDRILWRGTNIKQLRYGRYELLTSDHRPVFALFQVEAKSIVQAQRQLVYQDIVKQLDKLENDIQPDAVISFISISFVLFHVFTFVQVCDTWC
jgi:phosphatidylinositol-bisphosphatase